MSAFKFAQFAIPNQVFFQSKLSLGLVNLKPLVPGHVLVIPKRITPRFSDLSSDEVSDLFASVQRISRVVEKEYEAKSLTIACQDGPYAGQSVVSVAVASSSSPSLTSPRVDDRLRQPHVHIHILPRHAGDFEPKDAIYTALDSTDITQDHQDAHRAAFESRQKRADRVQGRPVIGVDADEDRKPRSMEQMKEEAMKLSGLFPKEDRGEFE